MRRRLQEAPLFPSVRHCAAAFLASKQAAAAPQVRGKDFRHEKTKKKRGTYKGGLIESAAVNSFKFDSDDE